MKVVDSLACGLADTY